MLTPGVVTRNREQGQVGAMSWLVGVGNCSLSGFGSTTNWLHCLDLFSSPH